MGEDSSSRAELTRNHSHQVTQMIDASSPEVDRTADVANVAEVAITVDVANIA